MSPKRLSRFTVVSGLTVVVSIVWLGMFVVRLFWHISSEAAPTIDAAMLLILGYWFSSTAVKNSEEEKSEKK
jgi:putative flippase GtrA